MIDYAPVIKHLMNELEKVKEENMELVIQFDDAVGCIKAANDRITELEEDNDEYLCKLMLAERKMQKMELLMRDMKEIIMDK